VDAESSDEDDDKELAPRSPLAINADPASRLPDELCDTAVVVEGLGSLSLSPATSRGSISEVPIPAGTTLLPSSLLWEASLSSDEDDCDEVLAPHTPLASPKGVVFGSVPSIVDERHDEKVPAEPYNNLYAAVAA
jgi:hypothetical protein